MKNAEKFAHPTRFTGNWPDWNGYTWLDWAAQQNAYHPGEDYNFGSGDQDCGQAVKACANGIVVHTSESNKGYGKLIIIKHNIGYNLKRFIKETYGIETDQLLSLYAHLKDILVSVGNKIDCDALIAHVGNTGTKWCHLHFEIFSLWKDLKNTTYRFYPVGWSKDKVKENWLPAYLFIEATKNLEIFDQFLGKSKEYWLQVEEDRKSLLKQLSEKEKEFLKIQTDLVEKRKEVEKENKQLKIESANFDKKAEKTGIAHQKAVEKLEEKISTQKTEIENLKKRITSILSEQSEKYQIGDAVILLIELIKKRLGGGEKK